MLLQATDRVTNGKRHFRILNAASSPGTALVPYESAAAGAP
jgi:hypothetical protein